VPAGAGPGGGHRLRAGLQAEERRRRRILGEKATQASWRERARLGLDRPLPVQFAAFVRDLATLDLPRSVKTGQPIPR